MIDQPHYWLSFGGYDTAQIQINVPKGYNLDKIEVNMSAGSTKINGLKAEKIEANAAAGRLVLNDLECKDFELDARDVYKRQRIDNANQLLHTQDYQGFKDENE